MASSHSDRARILHRFYRLEIIAKHAYAILSTSHADNKSTYTACCLPLALVQVPTFRSQCYIFLPSTVVIQNEVYVNVLWWYINVYIWKTCTTLFFSSNEIEIVSLLIGSVPFSQLHHHYFLIKYNFYI